MSPFGGRGLNSGVQDSWNLVWKLVMVRAGLAPVALLDTYHDERHPASLENLRLTADTMNFLVPQPGLPRLKRDMILRLSLSFKFMRRFVNAGHMSNPFTYLTSPIISEDCWAGIGRKLTSGQQAIHKRFRTGPVAGALAPAIILPHASTNESISFLERFSRAFTVLYFCDNADEGLKALQRVQPELPAFPLALYLVTPCRPSDPLPSGLHVLLDSERKGAHAYNAGARTLYVVRPDRHIAARRFLSDLSELPILLRRAIGEALDNTPVKEQVAWVVL